MNFFKDMISAYLIPPMSSCYSVKKKNKQQTSKKQKKTPSPTETNNKDAKIHSICFYLRFTHTHIIIL